MVRAHKGTCNPKGSDLFIHSSPAWSGFPSYSYSNCACSQLNLSKSNVLADSLDDVRRQDLCVFSKQDLHGIFTNSSLSWFTAMMIADELLPVIYLNTFTPAAGMGFCFLVIFCFGRFFIITESLNRVNAHSCLWTQDMVSTSWQIKFPSFMLMISL